MGETERTKDVKPGPGPAPEPVERDDVRVLGSPHRCPFCHEQVDAGAADQVACRGCLARHHGECWRESGRCAACGHTAALSSASEREGPRPSVGLVAVLSIVAAGSLVLLLVGAGVVLALRGAEATPRAGSSAPLDLSGSHEEVTARVRARAETGDPAAMNLLGFRLMTGQGCRKDEAEAFRWGLRAAEAGHVEAMFGIAGLLEQGLGTPRDEKAAASWYRRAIAGGDTMAGPALERLLQRRPDLR